MLFEGSIRDVSWSSAGLGPAEAFRQWQSWACATLSSLDIDIPDHDRFAARFRTQDVGPLKLVSLAASPQRVFHASGRDGIEADPIYHLIYCRRTPVTVQIGTDRYRIAPGDITFFDRSKAFAMAMDDHEANVLVIPGTWLERWVPEPARLMGRAFSASKGWGQPLGGMLAAMRGGLDAAVLPANAIADQIGACLALAVGKQAAGLGSHRGRLVTRLLRMIEERHADPAVDPGEIARTLGISKRYLHALLAESGTTFGGTLNRFRLSHARELLIDPRLAQLQIGEVAWRCGYLDPSYFARVFRQQFGSGPREWRCRHAG